MNNTPGSTRKKPVPHRQNVILGDLQEVIEAISVQDGISISEVIRRAVRRDLSLRRLSAAGSRIIIRDADGHERELVWSDSI